MTKMCLLVASFPVLAQRQRKKEPHTHHFSHSGILGIWVFLHALSYCCMPCHTVACLVILLLGIPGHPGTTKTWDLGIWGVKGPSRDVLTFQDIPSTTGTPYGNPGHHSNTVLVINKTRATWLETRNIRVSLIDVVYIQPK